MAVGMPEFVENPENRCPVILLLDTSGSMTGQPIQELNRGLAAFKQDVQKDSQASLSVEVAMITFGPIVKLTQHHNLNVFIYGFGDFNKFLLTGQNDKIYYTADHYNSFQ